MKPPLFHAVLFVALAWGGAVSVRAERLVQLDGSAVQGTVHAIDAQGQVRLAPDDGGVLDLQNLRLIDRQATPAAPSPPGAVVYLTDGSMIPVHTVALQQQQCVMQWDGGDDLRLSLDVVRGLFLAPSAGWSPQEPLDDGFAAALRATEPAQTDVFFVRTEKNIQQVTGLLQGLTATEGRLLWNNQPKAVARARLYGIVLARLGAPPDVTGRCRLTLQNGAAIWLRLIQLQAGVLHGELAGGTRIDLPWAAVVRLEVRSRRLVFTSDLEPAAVVQETLVTGAWPWRRDRSVLGQPLVLDEQTYAKGLGVHAPCRLTYDLAGEYAVFSAVIGLQPPVKGLGDVVFVVLGDDRELWRAHIKGSDLARAISVPITGVHRLTLAVEPGADLDLAAHADWADARFLRPAGAR